MEHSEDLFDMIVKTVPNAIFTIDSGGKIIFWNKEAEKLFGYSIDEILNKHLTDLMLERFRESYKLALNSGLPTSRSQPIGVVGLRRDGTEFPIEISLYTWKKGDKAYLTGFIRDITKRKQAEETLCEDVLARH